MIYAKNWRSCASTSSIFELSSRPTAGESGT